MSAELDAAFASDDPEVRRRAVASLSDPEDGARRLARALGDADWRVRKEAARVATERAEAWALLPALVEGLCQGENVGLRNAALEVLERLGPSAADALLEALPRVPETARKFIVAALGFAGHAGVEKLAELANDRDANTAQAALEALAKVGGPRAEEALRGHLASDDPVQRLAAVDGLERLEARVALEELEPLLRDRLVRRLALRLLAFSDDPRAVIALFGALDGGALASAEEAAIALGRLLERGGSPAREVGVKARAMDDETRQTLRALASDGRAPARRAATWVLLLARDREVLSTAAELAADDRLPPVALEAVRSWGEGAIQPLLAIAPTLGARAQAAAIEMASELGASAPDPAEIRGLLVGAAREALASDEPLVASAAAAALATWGEASDAAALVESAARFGEPMARAAGRALERLATHYPDAVERALASTLLDGPVGAGLLPAALALGGAQAEGRLQATLNADDPRARCAAVLALPKLGGERAAELAGFALADEDLDVQVAAVHVLAQLAQRHADDPEPLGVAHLRLALRATTDPVARAAAQALGAIGDRASIPVLRELVPSGRPGVAVAAMESLRTMDDPALETLLVEALGQDDEELVKEALRALAQASSTGRAGRIALGLEHAAWDVRQLAARLLGQLGGEGAAALRARLAREADPGVRQAIEDALACLGDAGSER